MPDGKHSLSQPDKAIAPVTCRQHQAYHIERRRRSGRWHHSPNKKLTGLTLAEIRQRLGDLHRAVVKRALVQKFKITAKGKRHRNEPMACDFEQTVRLPKNEAFTGQATTLSATRAQAAEGIIGMDDATPIPDADAS
jgi:hypothetical protein